MLVAILHRAQPFDENVQVFDWIEQTYDEIEHLDQNAIEEAITSFKNALMARCVDSVYRLSAAEKYRCGLREFMTADELSTFLPVE